MTAAEGHSLPPCGFTPESEEGPHALQAPEGSSGTVGGREVIGSRVVLPSHQRYECTPASTLASSGAAIALSSTEGSQRVRCMHGGGAREASSDCRRRSSVRTPGTIDRCGPERQRSRHHITCRVTCTGWR